MADTQEQFNEWALLELFGHQRIAGRVTNATIGGGSFVRVDVPDKNGATRFTRYFNPSAVYSISPCSEAIAVAAAVNIECEPIKRYELDALAESRQRALPGVEEDEDTDYQ